MFGRTLSCLQTGVRNDKIQNGSISWRKIIIQVTVIKKLDLFTVTHLANQHYATCWRRESGYCAVCYYPKVAIGTVAGNAAATQSSFGVS